MMALSYAAWAAKQTDYYPTTSFGMNVLAIGTGLLVLGLALLGWMMIYFKTSILPQALSPEATRLTLEEKAYNFYRESADKIYWQTRSDDMSFRDAHVAWAAILRGAASLASGHNLEVVTAWEMEALLPHWTRLHEAIGLCESVAFAPHNADIHSADDIDRSYGIVVSVLQQLHPGPRWDQ